MKLIVLLVAAPLLLGGCRSAVQDVRSEKVEDVITNPGNYSGRKLNLSGCVFGSGLGDLRITACGNKAASSDPLLYIDLVGNMTGDAIGAEVPVCVSGVFRAYDKSYRGMGYLTSEIGLMNASGTCVGHPDEP